MAQSKIGWTLSELAEIVGGELHGPAEIEIVRPVPAGYGDPHGITFAETERYLKTVEQTSVGAVIVSEQIERCSKPHIKHRNPREAFGRILAISWRDMPLEEGVHPTAVVSPSAKISHGVSIGAYCVVEADTTIEEGSRLYPFVYVGEHCKIGRGAKLYPHVTLYRDVSVGERTIIHSGAVIGADGFGFFWDGSKRRKVPQTGGVEIGADCEIGALTAVDRATAGETRIKEGTKIDNLVQIAHNVEIGEHSVIAGQCGISGSSTIGARAVMGGQCGIGDHIEIAEDVQLGARSGVSQNIEKPGQYWGAPAREAKEEMRIWLLTSRLPELVERIKQLEKEVARLSSHKHES